jgi:GNAT superfamily N-acetyltransferase
VLDARTRRRVLDAAAGMEWHPDGAIEVLTDDYRLIRYPDWALDPAFPAAQVTRSRSGRPATEVIEEVTARVRRWGLPGVAWWVASGTRPPDPEAALRVLAGWSSFREVASLETEPVSTGGCTLHGEVAQLWGAVTLREHRRRGCYRAVLAERLRLARAHGATLALVKGRPETSGPILRRAGFTDCDTERCFWLPT